MDPQYYGNQYQYQGEVPPEVGAAAAGIFAGMFIFILLIAVIFYVFFAICLMKIAQKTNTPNAWLAWIPIANLVLMIQVAKKPLWWIILFFIPLVNIVMSVLVWMAVAKERGKPDWLGILMIVPVANIIVPAYLAFSNGEQKTAVTS